MPYDGGVVRTAILACVLAGCVQVLGLDAPERVPSIADADEDGVEDSLDNCLGVANPDQADADGDRRGDACDSCPALPNRGDRDNDELDDACDSCLLGPQIDDDGDGIMDACDLCPVTPVTLQRDGDGDLIGDACDAPATALGADSTRLLFEPFTSPQPSWIGLDEWERGSDKSSLIAVAPGMARLARPPEALGSASVNVDVMSDAQVVVSFSAAVTCTLSCSAGMCTLTLRDADVLQSPPFAFRRGALRVTYRPPGFELGMWGCTLDADDQRLADLAVDVATRRFDELVVYASTGTRLTGVDLVR